MRARLPTMAIKRLRSCRRWIRTEIRITAAEEGKKDKYVIIWCFFMLSVSGLNTSFRFGEEIMSIFCIRNSQICFFVFFFLCRPSNIFCTFKFYIYPFWQIVSELWSNTDHITGRVQFQFFSFLFFLVCYFHGFFIFYFFYFRWFGKHDGVEFDII